VDILARLTVKPVLLGLYSKKAEHRYTTTGIYILFVACCEGKIVLFLQLFVGFPE